MNTMKQDQLKVCLENYFKNTDSIDDLVQFTGISISTARRWKKGEISPVGVTLLRLQYFLLSHGYKIAGFEQIPDFVFDLGKCIALNMVKLEDLQKRLNFDQYKRVYEYFRLETRVTPEKEKIIRDILSENQSTLTSEISKKLDEFRHSEGRVVNSVNSSKNDLIDQFSQACEKVRELGQKLLDGPVELRTTMRTKLVGTRREPALQCTWETLNKLLRERTKYE